MFYQLWLSHNSPLDYHLVHQMKDDHVRKPLYSFWSYLTTGWLQTIVHQYSTFLRIATQKSFFSRFRPWSQWFKITQNVAFEFWHFQPFFVKLKVTYLVALFDRKLQVSKNSPKLTIFVLFNELFSTQNKM